MKTELSDREYEVMNRFQTGRVHVGEYSDVILSLAERGYLDVSRATTGSSTFSCYELSFKGLRIFEEEKIRRSPVTSFLKSVFPNLGL